MSPLIATNFDILPDILDEPFLVSTLVGDSLKAKNVYKGFTISLTNRVTLVNLIEIDMFDFDVIFGTDWLHVILPSIDCWTRVVKYKFSNKLIFH